MRFNGMDWLRLILACIVASAAIAGVSGATGAALGFRRSVQLHAEVALALSLLATPLNVLAMWPVLRRCVDGLRLAPWLTETVLGAVLGGIVALPALAYLVLGPGGSTLIPPYAPRGPVGWLPPVAASVMALLPPGLLLQRLSGARAWPSLIVVTTAMAVLPFILGWTATHALVPFALLVGQIVGEIAFIVTMAVVAVVMPGVLMGLTLGAGLFLMARLFHSAVAP